MGTLVADDNILERAFEVGEYLPIFPRSEDDARYLESQLDQLRRSCESQLYQAASLHLHLLYMSIVYYQIFRIKEMRHEDYALACTYIRDRNRIENAGSPFVLSGMKEAEAFEFYRVLGVQPEVIGNLKHCVKMRNNQTHANPAYAIPNAEYFAETLKTYLGELSQVVSSEEGLLFKLYQNFEEGYDTGAREYTDTSDEVREVFVKGNSLSRREVALLLRTVDKRLKPIRGNRASLIKLLQEYAST